MALVHEQLQDEGDLSQIQLREYLQDLVGHVLRAHGAESISVTVDCDDSRLDIQRAVPCGLIVNELLTNALEHAFAEGVAGSVSVVFHEEGRTFVLSVADTGSGIRAGAKQSLGMTLVDALTRQLGGSLETSSADGTTITLRFASGS
jgi:two-component sensor histidine kinase